LLLFYIFTSKIERSVINIDNKRPFIIIGILFFIPEFIDSLLNIIIIKTINILIVNIIQFLFLFLLFITLILFFKQEQGSENQHFLKKIIYSIEN